MEWQERWHEVQTLVWKGTRCFQTAVREKNKQTNICQKIMAKCLYALLKNKISIICSLQDKFNKMLV